MTRVNVIPPSELSDQHLIAEYHELPRVIKQNINISGAPRCFCGGRAHIGNSLATGSVLFVKK